MQKIAAFTRLLRPKHYLKNVLVLLPIVFSGDLFNAPSLMKAIYSLISFSMIASAVYVINDIHDVASDRLHPKKKLRPIASNEITVPQAATLAIVLVLVGFVINYFASGLNLVSFGMLTLYLAINVAYSLGLKNIPIADIVILSSGFLIRVLYGANIVGVPISQWLYLTVLAFAFYMSLGKRRNEIRQNGISTRKVNKYYSQEFLDKNMYMQLGLAIMFYSLWSIDPIQNDPNFFWTIPIVIIILMVYSLNIEKPDSDGDPVDVLLSNKILPILVLAYALVMLSLIYF